MEILIICSHTQILATIARLIDSNNDWRASTACSVEEAITLIAEKKIDVILVGSGISETEENKLQNHLNAVNNNTPVVKHYGGGSGLLYAEIYQAFSNK